MKAAKQNSSARMRLARAASSTMLTLVLAAGLMPAQALAEVAGGVVIS